MNIRAATILLFLICSPVLAFGQKFSTPVPISKDPGAHSPAMHVGRDGTIFVSWFENNADIYFSRSTDGGTTFVAPIRASRQLTTNQYTSLLQRAPEFAIDTKGTIHLVWMEARIGTQSDIWYVRSTDNGTSWTQPLSIMDPGDSEKYDQDFPAIACDSSNNLYVSYLDNRYVMQGLADHYKMQLERSTDGGTTWSLPVIADKLPVENSGTCECCRQDIAVSPAGHVYIAFRTNMTEADSTEKRDIFICRSMNGGLTFDSSIRCQLGGWTLTGCPTKGPHTSLDSGENLHVAWSDARDDSDGKLNSYFSLLRKGDTAVFPNYTVNRSGQSASWPDLAVCPNGLVAFAYIMDNTSEPNRFSYSSDGGNTWARNIAFPGASSDDQSLPALEFGPAGNVCAVWEDATVDGILFSNFSGLPKPQTSSAIGAVTLASYEASSPIRLAWTKPAQLNGAPFVWYHVSIQGLTTQYDTRDTSLYFDSLPVGQYYLDVTAYSTLGRLGSAGGIFYVNAPASVSQDAAPTSGVFPNPATNGVVTIAMPELQNELASVKILDEDGKAVRTMQVRATNGNLVLNVSGLSPGTYRASITSGDATFQEAVTIP
jgi:hypothetical protein